MKTEAFNPAELRTAGCKALAHALGPLGMARFLRQFEQGNGDYTRDRKKWLREPLQTVSRRIRNRKKPRNGN